MTRKMLTMAGAFDRASDVDRLYVERNRGGRGIKSIEDLFEIRMVGLAKQIEEIGKNTAY